jgi:tricorn protease
MARGYLRFPHVSGDLLTFVAEDDVWLAPVAGGTAWRVTTDHVPVSRPRLSPDGQRIAWASTVDGAPEVHVVDLDGGDRRRLTYFGTATTAVLGWTADGRVLAVSHAGQESRSRRLAYAVGLDGGQPEPLPYGYVSNVALAPGGAALTATAGTVEVAWWKRYRGGTATKLWLDRRGDGDFQRLFPEEHAPLESPLWLDDGATVGFVSDRDGSSEIWAADLPTDRLPVLDDLRRLTDTPYYVRHATSDGRRVVFQCGGEIWRWEGGDAAPIAIELTGERRATVLRPIDASRSIGAVAPAVDGRASAMEVRGSISWVTHRDGPVRVLAAGSATRRRLPVVLTPGGDVAWVSDAGGDDAIELFAAADGTTRTVAAGEIGRVLELTAAPDGSLLAGASHDGRLWVLTVATGELREVDRTVNGDITGLTFSPDSRWLAWSRPGPLPLAQIRVAEVSEAAVTPIDVTPLRFADTSPAFSADGKYLAFLSTRSFDPIYDAYVFDLSFPNGSRPQLVALAATTPSPFDPDLGGRAPAPAKDGAAAVEGAAQVTVDASGLDQRVVPFPVPAARFASLQAVAGGFVWLRSPLSGELGDDLTRPDDDRPRPALERFDLMSRRTETLVDALDRFAPTGDGKRLVVVDKHEVRVIPADRKVSAEEAEKSDDVVVAVDLSRVRVTVEPGAEWAQMYDEAGRLMRDHYFRPDMGGTDWEAALARYRPLVERLGSADDFVDLLWETQGELGTSHAYVRGRPPENARSQGMLGAELTPDGDGRWRVQRILPGEPSDPRARSPLTAPGVAMTAGDAIVAVDGRPVDPRWGPAALLSDTAGKPVALTIETAAGERRTVVVTPLGDETPLRYQAWVAGRRAFTHDRSDGRLGYLHVPDMASPGWAQLHRDLRLEFAREGLILDLRDNGGGHTSQLVVEKVARRIVGWVRSRGFEPESYPTESPRGPVVTVVDEQAGSDGDIATAAIKALGVGPVVGTRTWGGVVGIDNRYALVDGTSVTQPRYAFWLQGYDWGVENYGVDPDIEVVRSPADIAAGRDPQLERAIDIALESLAAQPATSPPELPAP